ncbi:MAG: hypothetical protein MI802_01685, partial [Desulfobacterales bacterium]|nr:hypothetical protein [Desulfobacterales bacterium]
MELERKALGGAFVAEGADWNVRAAEAMPQPNILKLVEMAGALIDDARPAAFEAMRQAADHAIYEDVVLFVLYHRYYKQMNETFSKGITGSRAVRVSYYPRFAADFEHYLGPAKETGEPTLSATHAMAFCFQVRRAFLQIFHHLIGASAPTVRLRAAIWQSIFTHDLRRYRRTLYDRMGEITTLITGPSGSGKEVVAKAIGRSRYIP